MGLALAVTITLTEISCGECGGTYAINERYRQQKYQKGECWTCPYCKTTWGYSGKGENAQLKRELEEERQRKFQALERANAAEAAQRKAQGKLNRVNRGVCPSCNRTFQNLARHMCTQHGHGDAVKIGKPKLP